MNVAAEHVRRSLDLAELLENIAEAPAVSLRGITDDSRRVKDGDLFVALQGSSGHGLEHAEAAIAAGAAAIVWDASTGDPHLAAGSIPFVAVDNLASHQGELANRWYDWPSRSLDVFAVTGTNGKTTVAFLAAQCLQRLGQRCGYLGTLGHGIDELSIDTGLTTPPCFVLHGALDDMRSLGAAQVAIEASSHALAQNRLAGIRLDAAIFTNLSRDHVDYHGDMDAYAETKARLFSEFESNHRIVSVDCEFGRQLATRYGDDVITTSAFSARSAKSRRHVIVRSAVADADGSTIRITSSWGDGELTIPMPGDFNISNAVEVLALLLAKGVDFNDAREVMGQISAPPGRLQEVMAGAGPGSPRVYIDYAHTPAALEAVLQALRAHTAGDLWCVFGCGGDRDVGKRPLMGATVDRLAEHGIVTNDNPRTEPPGKIIGEVIAPMNEGAIAIEDRAAAIDYAVTNAMPGDTVLVAGKGHENYQIVGTERRDFSDYQVARESIKRRAASGTRA